MPHDYMDDVRKAHDDKLARLGAMGEHPSKRAEIRYEDAIEFCSDCGDTRHETKKYMKG